MLASLHQINIICNHAHAHAHAHALVHNTINQKRTQHVERDSRCIDWDKSIKKIVVMFFFSSSSLWWKLMQTIQFFPYFLFFYFCILALEYAMVFKTHARSPHLFLSLVFSFLSSFLFYENANCNCFEYMRVHSFVLSDLLMHFSRIDTSQRNHLSFYIQHPTPNSPTERAPMLNAINRTFESKYTEKDWMMRVMNTI